MEQRNTVWAEAPHLFGWYALKEQVNVLASHSRHAIRLAVVGCNLGKALRKAQTDRYGDVEFAVNLRLHLLSDGLIGTTEQATLISIILWNLKSPWLNTMRYPSEHPLLLKGWSFPDFTFSGFIIRQCIKFCRIGRIKSFWQCFTNLFLNKDTPESSVQRGVAIGAPRAYDFAL